ncbi:hypothetical protein O3P69_010442 [Scylla paramamosain]|uniref:Transmembrane protein n=1 Tax=Scylla paramamosain TaxID=85552 RepID=A0AAW0TVY0_SCYPA
MGLSYFVRVVVVVVVVVGHASVWLLWRDSFSSNQVVGQHILCLESSLAARESIISAPHPPSCFAWIAASQAGVTGPLRRDEEEEERTMANNGFQEEEEERKQRAVTSRKERENHNRRSQCYRRLWIPEECEKVRAAHHAHPPFPAPVVIICPWWWCVVVEVVVVAVVVFMRGAKWWFYVVEIFASPGRVAWRRKVPVNRLCRRHHHHHLIYPPRRPQEDRTQDQAVLFFVAATVFCPRR